MNIQEIRLELLKICRPTDIANPDVKMIIDRAKALEAYVTSAGHAIEPPRQAPMQPQPQARTHQPSSGPAHRK